MFDPDVICEQGEVKKQGRVVKVGGKNQEEEDFHRHLEAQGPVVAYESQRTGKYSFETPQLALLSLLMGTETSIPL